MLPLPLDHSLSHFLHSHLPASISIHDIIFLLAYGCGFFFFSLGRERGEEERWGKPSSQPPFIFCCCFFSVCPGEEREGGAWTCVSNFFYFQQALLCRHSLVGCIPLVLLLPCSPLELVFILLPEVVGHLFVLAWHGHGHGV